jgi:hypothetical protein
VLPPNQGILTLPSGAELNVDKKTWIKPEIPTASHSIRTRHWLAQQLQLTEVVPATYYQPASKEASSELCTCKVVHKGWVVIDHKSNPQPADKWIDIAQDHIGQLQAYRETLESLSDKPVISTLVHFSCGGRVSRG